MAEQRQFASGHDQVDEAPLVVVLVFEGGPLGGARQPWIGSTSSLRVRSIDAHGALSVARGRLHDGDLGVYRFARCFADEEDWIIELRWIGGTRDPISVSTPPPPRPTAAPRRPPTRPGPA